MLHAPEPSLRARAAVFPRAALLAGAGLGGAALVALHLLLRHTYWDYSEGVYALTAHLLLHGQGLYSGMAGAQPPGVFLLGAGLLAIHDSLEWLRFGVGAWQLLAGLLAARIVWRLSASRFAAALTPAAMLLTPWAVHEHGALTPELVALPLLLGAAVLAEAERGAAAAGVLCGLLPVIKYPFVIPAVVLVAMSADRRRTAMWALGTCAVALGITAILAGSAFWRETVQAQTQTGRRSLGRLDGFWAQAGWNVLGLAIPAGALVAWRRQVPDRRALSIALGLAAAMVVTFLTNFKEGTGLNITVPVEGALVPLAVAGTALALREAGGPRRARHRLAGGVCTAAALFTLAQSISLIASPHHSVPFLRAGSRPAWAVLMTAPQFDAAVARARRCPPGIPYSGPPLLAFAGGRPMPAGQPDQFIVTHSRVLSAIRRRIAAVRILCP